MQNIRVNETGARTLTDARPMLINGQAVFVTVDAGAAQLHVGGVVVAEQAAERLTTREAQDMAVAYRESLTAPAAAVAEAEATEAETAAVEAIRAEGAAQAAAADETITTATPYRFRNSRGRMVTLMPSDPRHPSQAARQSRLDGEALAAWTVRDERRYMQYVTDGLGDTDGFYAPLDRAAWKHKAI